MQDGREREKIRGGKEKCKERERGIWKDGRGGGCTKKLFYRYSIGGHFLFYIFCCKIETVDFFYEKSAIYAKMSLKLPRQN